MGKGLYPEYKGDVLTRDKLTEIFKQYVFAHMETARNSGFLTPTLMFIVRDLSGADDLPSAAPFNLNTYEDKELEDKILYMLEDFPPDRFAVEMVLYARFKPNWENQDQHDVLLGARDMRAGTIHSTYTYIKKGDAGKFKHKKISPAFDQWIPHHKGVMLPFDPIKDEYLRKAVAMCAMYTTKALAHAKQN